MQAHGLQTWSTNIWATQRLAQATPSALTSFSWGRHLVFSFSLPGGCMDKEKLSAHRNIHGQTDLRDYKMRKIDHRVIIFIVR